MSNELYQHKRSDTIKWVLTLLAFILVGVMLAGIILGWFEKKEESPAEEEQTEQAAVIDGEGNAMDADTVYAMPTAMSFSAASLAQARAQFNEPSGTTITSDESVDVRIEAYVRPDDAANKKVDFSVSWGTAPTHGSEPVENYLTVTPDSDGSAAATVTCKQPFGSDKIVITVTTREGGYIDTCRVVFVGDPTSLAVSCEEATTASGSFGSYYELGVGNSYTFDLTPDNAFGFVGAECNYSYTVTGYGSFKVQQQKYSTSYGTRTWVEGTEKTVNIKDVTTVSKYEPSVFDWAIEGDKLKVTVNCTLDSYYTDSIRVENTITYDDKFREYTDDNWYYEVKVTETNSGVSHTFKVRPVKVVTNVVLGDDVITF